MILLDVRGCHIHAEPASDHVAVVVAADAVVDDVAGMTLQLMYRDGSDSTFHHRRL